jgi:hypothetical protein
MMNSELDQAGWGFAYMDVDFPPIAWNVYRGAMVSFDQTLLYARGGVAWRSASLLRDGAFERFLNEITIESFRRRYYPRQASRLTGLFSFPDFASAVRAERWGAYFCSDQLVELAPEYVACEGTYDADWISEPPRSEDGLLDRTQLDWLHRYFRKEPKSSTPTWERVSIGRVSILGKKIRKCAYSTIVEYAPKCRELLEIARIGAAVGSNLGCCIPQVFANESSVALRYLIDMTDAENDDVLSRIARYQPKNHADLSAVDPDVFYIPNARMFGNSFPRDKFISTVLAASKL